MCVSRDAIDDVELQRLFRPGRFVNSSGLVRIKLMDRLHHGSADAGEIFDNPLSAFPRLLTEPLFIYIVH